MAAKILVADDEAHGGDGSVGDREGAVFTVRVPSR